MQELAHRSQPVAQLHDRFASRLPGEEKPNQGHFTHTELELQKEEQIYARTT